MGTKIKKNYTKTAVQGTIVIFMFTIFSVFIGFLLRTLLAKNLSVSDYGLLYAVLALFGFVALFRDAGLNPALVKYIPEFLVKRDKKNIKTAIRFTFIVQLIFTSMIFFVILYVLFYTSILTQILFKTQASIPVVILIGLSFAAGIGFHLMQSIFMGFQKMKYYAILDPIRLSIIFVVAFFTIHLGLGVSGVALAYFIGVLISGIIGFFIFLKIFPFFRVKTNKFINKNLRHKLQNFAIPVIGGGIASIVASYIDTLMITYFKTLEDVGYYQVALPISDLVGLFVGAMSIVTFPMVSELWARKKKVQINNGISILTKFSIISIAPIALVIFLFSETIIEIFFGSKYLPAVTTLRILVIAVVFQALTTIYFAALKGMGKIRDVVKGIVLLSILLVVLNFFLVQQFGIVGTAISTLVAYFFTCIFMFFILKKSISIKIKKTDIIKIVIALTIASIVGYYMKENVQTFFYIPSIIASLSAYLVSIVLLGIIRKKDIKALEESGIRLPKTLYKIAR